MSSDSQLVEAVEAFGLRVALEQELRAETLAAWRKARAQEALQRICQILNSTASAQAPIEAVELIRGAVLAYDNDTAKHGREFDNPFGRADPGGDVGGLSH